MIQKIIAYLYKRQVTKTYNDREGFISSFVLEYKSEEDNAYRKISCFAVNFEPRVFPNVNTFLADVDVYSSHNVSYKSDKLYLNQARVLRLEPLMNESEIEGAKEEIKRYYKQWKQQKKS